MQGQLSWQEPTWPGAIPWLEVDLEKIGLVVVDLQYSCADPARTPARARRDDDPEGFDAWARKIAEQVIPNNQRLLAWFRQRGLPVIYTRVGSLLPDAEDQHPKRRLAWLRSSDDAPPYRSPLGSPDYEILPQVAPRPDELIVDKNASGAFSSSAIDFYLRSLGLQTLVVTGVSTFACVDGTARDAADRGYNVILVEDACAGSTGGAAASEATFRAFRRHLGAVKTTDQLLEELTALLPPLAVPVQARG
jgi:nicotinamidase-related amidase